MKKIISLVILLVVVLNTSIIPTLSHAESYDMVGGTYGDFKWMYQDGVLTFSGEGEIGSYTGGLVVNYEYHYPWQSISGKVKKIVFEEGITKISTDILTETHKSVEEIVIPASLVDIDGGLQYCTYALKNIIVDENNSAYSSVDGVLFDQEQTKLIKYPSKKIGSTYTVPDSVKVIGASAFYLSKLTEIVFGNALIEIENGGFYYSTKLTNVTLPESLVTIGEKAFQECSSLEKVVFGNNVTDIGDAAFYKCNSLVSVNLPKSVINIGTSAFYQSPIENIELGNNLMSLGGGAFAGTNIEKIIIPGAISKIDKYTFASCKNLKEVIIEEGVETIVEDAFYDCSTLEKVVIPKSVITIEHDAFSNCNLLWKNDNLYIGEWLIDSKASGEYSIKAGTEKIANYAFGDCENLTLVKVPESVKTIGYNVFACRSLEEIYVDNKNTRYSSLNGVLYDKSMETIIYYPTAKKDETFIVPEGVKTISDNAFSIYIEDWIKRVELSDSVENIGTAFRHLGMEEIALGDGIKTLDKYAFYSCKNLKKIEFGNNVQTIGEAAFQKCISLDEVVFSDSVEIIEKGAFLECYNLKNLHLPSSLKIIGDSAFMYCAQLEELYIPKSVTNIGSDVVNFCDNVNVIYYGGSEELWKQITKGTGNASLDGLIVCNYRGIRVNVNGNEVDFTSYKQPPYIKNGRTLVSMRAVFEALEATITWDDATKTAIGVKDDVEVKITIGENVIYKNGEAITLDCAAEITNDRTMVPVRAISEAFGCTVEWNNETKTVEITN